MKVTVYLSHTIRGKKGITATKEDTDNNCQKALLATEWLRTNVSSIDLYVPAESEPFVQLAYDLEYLSEERILEIDCKILEQKDFLIVLMEDGWIGGGIGVEIKHAQNKNIPIFFLESNQLNWDTLHKLHNFIDLIIREKMNKG